MTEIYDGAWLHVVFASFEVPLLVFHLTVLICVVRCVITKEQFATGAFFKIYIMKSLVDCVGYICINGFSRFVGLGGNIPIHTESFFWIIVDIIRRFSPFFETAADTLMSATRYTAIVHPMIHQKIWTGSRLKILLVALIVAPAVAAIVVVRIEYFLYTSDVPKVVVISVAFTVTNAVLSALMAFRALHLYLRMTQHRRKTSYEDYRLLVCAILNLFTQILLASCYALNLLAWDFFFLGSQFLPAKLDNLLRFIAFSGPFFLLWTSKSIRVAYTRMMCGCFMANSTENSVTTLVTPSEPRSHLSFSLPKTPTLRLGLFSRGRRH